MLDFARRNRAILEEASSLIRGRLGQPPIEGRALIGIAGAGCLGKSVFARTLASFLRSQGYGCDFVELDGYLLDRRLRECHKPAISGYHPRAFDLGMAHAQLGEWQRSGKPFPIQHYDKTISKRVPGRVINARDLLVVEGVSALYSPIYQMLSLRIFLDADKGVQFRNRMKREQQELGLSRQNIEAKFRGLFVDYLHHVRPSGEAADLVIEVGEGYEFALQACVRPLAKTAAR